MLLVVLLSAFSLVHAQEYVPFPTSNVYWNEIELYQGQCDPPEYCKNTFYLMGDTVIDSYLYKKIYSNDGNSTSYVGGLREENKRVFLYYTWCDHSVLLYDFNLNVGDTMFMSCLALECDINENNYMTVVSVDSVLLEDQSYRRRINFDSGPHMSWIEGVGSVSGLLYPHYSCILCICFRELICFQEDVNTLYLNEENAACFNYCVSVSDLKNNDKMFQVYPNPAKYQTSVTIKSNEGINRVELYDFLGRMIACEQKINSMEYKLQLGNLRQGVYFLRANLQNSQIVSNRLIIN
ncbi:MAG TPA: T9SS type A sorting domain-containing protein [Bacteroidales bacterium]|nr:MAG: hypothetical protein BWX63_01049 [Bacteroidetes bacterium ADurb.Bin041]HPW42196.1 T9SS type A sorting domain-containing protein [Bacteroidales bacterium]